MKITVFTGNQPRHIALLERLAGAGHEVFAVVEANTLFPGLVDDFYRQSDVMKRYFARVTIAEKFFFGSPRFSPREVTTITSRAGDLNLLDEAILAPALSAEVFIVFGSSYIKGWLADFLVEKHAINVHMGLSPYYRGSSCNFWALYDWNPAMVGGTLHLLSYGLDNGPILSHAVPILVDEDAFQFTMKAVDVTLITLQTVLSRPDWRDYLPPPQESSKQIRYTRNSEFTDEVAEDFLSRPLDSAALRRAMRNSRLPEIVGHGTGA